MPSPTERQKGRQPQETLSDLLAAAIALHKAGKLAEAEELYRSILAADPRHADSLHLLGLIAHQTGRHALAIEKIGEAIELNSAVAAFHFNLGTIRRSRGEVDEAIACYQRALAIKPDYQEALFGLGAACQSLGRLDEAIASYAAAVTSKPDYAEALCNLGAALQAQGRLAEAIARYEQALAAKPGYAEALSNLGTALRSAGLIEQAIARYEQALAFLPHDPAILANLAGALREIGRLDEAISRCEQALAVAPDHLESLVSLAGALQRQGKLGAAVARYEQALLIRPDYPEALSNLGTALQEQGKIGEAIAHYERALDIRSGYAAARSNLLLAMHYSDAFSNQDIRRRTDEFSAQFESPSSLNAHANDRDPARRLRIGYVSGDFRSHPVGLFLASVLSEHDAASVEVFCYSNGAADDDVTHRLRRSAKHWRSIVGLADPEAALAIQQDGIDILVDLSGHTAENRLLLFARKPAPVQVTWLGYPGSTGLEAIDYRLVDAVTDPPGPADAEASEALIRLPAGFLCYGPPERAPEPEPPPSRDGGPITFGSFNNPSKLSDATLDVWAALLAQLPAARLLLKGQPFADAATRALFLARLGERGVAAERVTLVGWLPDGADHLALYGRMDIALDPFPYNGTTTSCEALWMGVPVVALRGRRHSGRVGASLLERVGLASLVAETPEEYVAIASDLAGAPERLAELRRALRPRMLSSPLCDTSGFTRTLEAAYRKMWRRWCQAESKKPRIRDL